MSFWEKTVAPNSQPIQAPITLDEQALAEIQGDPNLDLFPDGDPDENDDSYMHDANLRLEQGRLYQMILQNNIFENINADPRAVRNVQREMRNHARMKMENMLGMRLEQPKAQEITVKSDFNELEVTVLKMLASKMSKGQTEQTQQPEAQVTAPPKKDGITAISGTVRPEGSVSIKGQTKPAAPSKAAAKPQPKQATQAKSAINKSDGSALTKPIEEMTAEELAAHNAAAEDRSRRHRSAMPTNMMPHPSTQQLEMLYTMQANERLAQHAQKMDPNSR